VVVGRRSGGIFCWRAHPARSKGAARHPLVRRLRRAGPSKPDRVEPLLYTPGHVGMSTSSPRAGIRAVATPGSRSAPAGRPAGASVARAAGVEVHDTRCVHLVRGAPDPIKRSRQCSGTTGRACTGNESRRSHRRRCGRRLRTPSMPSRRCSARSSGAAGFADRAAAPEGAPREVLDHPLAAAADAEDLRVGPASVPQQFLRRALERGAISGVLASVSRWCKADGGGCRGGAPGLSTGLAATRNTRRPPVGWCDRRGRTAEPLVHRRQVPNIVSMNLLIIGGGIFSAGPVQRRLERGDAVTVFNRGSRATGGRRRQVDHRRPQGNLHLLMGRRWTP